MQPRPPRAGRACSRSKHILPRSYGGGSGRGGDGRLIIPGQPQRKPGGSGGLILPGQNPNPSPPQMPGQRPGPPEMPPGQANFPELGNEEAGIPTTTTTIRNFRPPTGFMNEDGPVVDPYAMKTTEQMLSVLTARSDHWFNLALAFPRLYLDGFDRATLEQIINVEPARQEVWSVAGNVYHSLQSSGELTKEQLAFFKSEEHGPDCLMELRFLDTEHRQEGARYIADNRLPPRESVVLARSIKERQRRPEAAVGFSERAGDCLAFKFFRDAEESRSNMEKERIIEGGIRVAETSEARARLQTLLDEIAQEAQQEETVLASMEIARLKRDELGSRLVPLAGAYLKTSSQAVADAPQLGGNGAFQSVTLPASSTDVVLLPRWNIIALAQRPTALSVADVAEVPEIAASQPVQRNTKDALKNRGQGLLVVDVGRRDVQEKAFFLADVDGTAHIVAGGEIGGRTVLGRILLVIMPPRQAGQVPDALDA